MKKYLLILFLFQLFNLTYSQEKTINQIIGKSIKIERLEVAQNDFPKMMDYALAKEACSKLGEGWRIPTESELKILFLNKDEYSLNMRKAYWSTSDLDLDYAVLPSFYFHETLKIPKFQYLYSVRAVRINKDFINAIIGSSIILGKLEVSQYDFPIKMNHNDAKKACTDLGEGWRLPTKEELNYLFLNRDGITGFTNNNYWSIATNNGSGAWSQNFSNGFQNLIFNIYTYSIRAVRTK
jgi:hypothetical protein